MSSTSRTHAGQDTKHANDSSASRINVLVYSGPGVSQSCLLHLKTALSKLLSTRYDVLSISAESLIRDPWTANCALLAFPGGRDLGYLSSLGEQGCARIANWVRNQGGRYLGLCAGAYFASDRIEFESGRQGFQVIGDRPLKFFPGACKGTTFPNFVYDSEDGARDAVITLEGSVWEQVWPDRPNTLDIYYNGGGYFDEPSSSDIRVIARYEELETKPPAGVVCRVGAQGKALLWGVHPEHPSTIASSASSSSNTQEEPRTALLRASLRLLDLEVPDRPRVPTDPTPLLLTAQEPSDAEQLGSSIMAALPKPSDNGGHQDLTNTFHFHQQSDIAAVFERVDPSSHTRQDIVICSQKIPSPSITPIFNLQAYFAHLASARKALSYAYKPSFGSELMYGEVVTSTQTVLDKNPHFLSALPSGFTFVGSHQIAGRGRGSNNWLSPPGCLQFSLVLRVPKAMGPQLVFAQYLFGLSVVEAVRTLEGYQDVGLRLKWPNDLYAFLGADQGLKKIGGILVNSTFAGGDFTVIIGCGINTTNSSPTTSLRDLIESHNAQSGSLLPVISQEQLLAAILARFEYMWLQFESEGSFAPFADLYTKRWLHSNREVMIQETGQRVRIVGLAPSNGYLRTVNLDNDSPLPEYIDLQPDGNSFDMMQGLLKTKRRS